MIVAGFYGAPVSKGLMVLVGLCSVGVMGGQLSLAGHSATPEVAEAALAAGVSLRTAGTPSVLLSRLAFASPAELVVGLILLYTFRVHERRLGSRRFSALALLSLLVPLTLDWTLLSSFESVVGSRLAAGPYAVIFALLVLQWVRVPAGEKLLSIGGFGLSPSALSYTLALQLALGRGHRSVLASLVSHLGICEQRC